MGRWLLRVELSLVRIFNPYLPDWELRLMGSRLVGYLRIFV